MLSTRALKPQTETVTVYTRHKPDCPRSGQPHYRGCKCNKYIYVLRGGEKKTISAKTRSWSVAEQKAADIRDGWDPVKLRLKELESRESSRISEAFTIERALERWLENVRSKDKSEATFSKYSTAAKQLNGWARSNGLVRLEQVTTDNLDQWKCSWNPNAKRREDRIGKTTAARRLELVKRFTKYCLKMGWIAADPASALDAIAPDAGVTLPLLGGRYEALLAATYQYDESMRPDDRFGQELRALFELMRWTGLRIGDALTTTKKGFTGNVLRTWLHKPKKWHTVIVPDHVIAALSELPPRSTVDPKYYFWSGNCKVKSLTGQWQRKLARLNDYLSLVDDEGKPMRFHSHQLRDTFSVTQLLNETRMEDLSQMLAHESILITQRYYAPWVPERQQLLQKKMTEALGRMGTTVSLSVATSDGGPASRQTQES